MVGFAAVFIDIIRRRALSEEASIHTAKMTGIKKALKEVYKREDKGWEIYTHSWSFYAVHQIQQKNYPISNQIFDILAELQN